MSNKHVNVLVTGATGFVGLHVCQHLLEMGHHVRAIGRKETFDLTHENLSYFSVENIDGYTDWKDYLHGIDVVVHLAARVHQMKDEGLAALSQYQEVNVKGTQQLARAAIRNNVKRFIYLSTIKVIAEKTIEMPVRAEEQPRPSDAYSLSKLQAEQILQEYCRRSGMEWVIIRPPLIYGPGVKGNFARLLGLAKSFLPLPLGGLKNKRSLVSIYNLCSFIECVLTHPNAHREVFLVSDNQDLSTSQLLRVLKKGLGKGSYLLPMPSVLLKLMGFFLGKGKEVTRLVDSLQLNIEKSMRLLGWRPPMSVEASIARLLIEG